MLLSSVNSLSISIEKPLGESVSYHLNRAANSCLIKLGVMQNKSVRGR